MVGRTQTRSRPISLQPSGPRKIGVVGALANASTTETPRSFASRSCFASSAAKIPCPRADACVVAWTENDASRSSPSRTIGSRVCAATPTTLPSASATERRLPEGFRSNHHANSSRVMLPGPQASRSSPR